MAQHITAGSKSSYARHWKRFVKYLNTFFRHHLLNDEILLLYLTHLRVDRGQAASTITSTLSALRYMLRCVFRRYVPEITDTFIVNNFIASLKKCSPNVDTRRPITIHMLNSFILDLKTSCNSTYDFWLYSAMYVFAFFALLRVGEITFLDGDVRHLLQNDCITFHFSNNVLVSMTVTIKSYKHSTAPFSVDIDRQKLPADPVYILYNYITLRGHEMGPLFCSRNLYPIHRSLFIKRLNLSLQNIGIEQKYYRSHSFRIGGATYAAENGMSDAKIRALGRWKSNAFKKYLRIAVVSNSFR